MADPAVMAVAEWVGKINNTQACVKDLLEKDFFCYIKDGYFIRLFLLTINR